MVDDNSRVNLIENRINEHEQRIKDLETFLNKVDADTGEHLNHVNLSLDQLKLVVYGEKDIRVKGLLDRFDEYEKILKEVREESRSEREERKVEKAKITGIQIGLGVLGGAQGLAIILQLFGVSLP